MGCVHKERKYCQKGRCPDKDSDLFHFDSVLNQPSGNSLFRYFQKKSPVQTVWQRERASRLSMFLPITTATITGGYYV